MEVSLILAVVGEKAALTAAGVLAILSAYASATALVLRKDRQLADSIEAVALVLIGTSGALASWRLVFAYSWVFVAAGLGGLAAIILTLVWAKRKGIWPFS